jgi:hypothetical protein
METTKHSTSIIKLTKPEKKLSLGNNNFGFSNCRHSFSQSIKMVLNIEYATLAATWKDMEDEKLQPPNSDAN